MGNCKINSFIFLLCAPSTSAETAGATMSCNSAQDVSGTASINGCGASATSRGGSSSSRTAPASPTVGTDEQFFSYCLTASALLNNIGSAHHDRDGEADEAMQSYSASIQIRIRAQDAAELYESAAAGGVRPRPRDDRPSVEEMDLHLQELQRTEMETRRETDRRKAEAGQGYSHPHDLTRNLHRSETHLVGLNTFSRSCQIPVQASELGVGSALSSLSLGESSCSTGSTGTAAYPAQHPGQAQPVRSEMKKSSMKRGPSSYGGGAANGTIDQGDISGDYSNGHNMYGHPSPAHQVQRTNALAAFTLYNIALLHQSDRSYNEARESYEIALTMVDSVPSHLSWNVGLLRVMIQNNLGFLAYRAERYQEAAERFQEASNNSLDLSMMYSPECHSSAESSYAYLRDERIRASRRKLARANVALLLNLSRALCRLQSHQESLDVANAALQLFSRMEEEAQAHPLAQQDLARQDDDGLDLSVIPYVRGRAHHGLNETVLAMEEYRAFMIIVESRHESSHPYVVAAMQSIMGLSQSDALSAIYEILDQTGGHAPAA